MQQLLLVVFLSHSYCSFSNAQVSTNPTQLSPDLLEPDANNWSGTFGTGYWGGSQNPATGPGNNQDPNAIPSGTGFVWGGNNTILSTTIAINQALQVAGVQVNGFEYEWRVKNGNANWFAGQPGIDDFVIQVDIYDAQGNIYATYQYDYSYSHNWTTHTGSETFVDPFLPPSYFGSVGISAQGSDSANWQGWYGPEFNVQASSFRVTFSANPCYNNPLYDPQCQGYATALFNQQCTQNPLFDPTCPGYNTANFTQLCAANPLYDPTCPGYAAAYLADRCLYDPLYDVQCTGYQQAYFDQQCELDSQYDQSCPNYLDPDIASLGTVDPVEEILSEPDVPVVTELDFTGTSGNTDGDVDVPEQKVVEVVEVEDGKGFQQVDDSIEGEQLQMEDDIEKEIAALENDAGTSDEDATLGDGNMTQEDDIEKELAELKESADSDNKKDAPKPKTKNEKIRLLLAMKAIELTKKLEKEVNLEQNMIMQRQLLALISYVPGFDYSEKKLPQVNFYPPKPTVDHAYARWFLNDPNFGAMEDSQYNFK